MPLSSRPCIDDDVPNIFLDKKSKKAITAEVYDNHKVNKIYPAGYFNFN